MANSGRGAQEGPARQLLREYLRGHRPRLPPILRWSLTLAGASVAGMALTLGLGFLDATRTGWQILQFVGLTTVSGPQAATLFVFAQDPPLGIWWVLAMTNLNTAATFLLIVPLAWRSAERLRDARFVGGAIRSAERFSVKHRKFLAKWGIVGLVLVTLAPVQGAGVLGAGILGVLLRVPLERLLAAIFVAGIVLNVAYTVAIKYAAEAMRDQGFVDVISYALIGTVLAASGIASWRGHRRRHRFEVETIPGTPDTQQAKLNAVGIVEEDLVLRADLRIVCEKLDIPADDLRRARNTAELLRLDNLPPKAGERLTAVGIVSIREMTLAPAALLRDALAEVGGFKVPDLAAIESWRKEAQRFDAAFHAQVNEATQTS